MSKKQNVQIFCKASVRVFISLLLCVSLSPLRAFAVDDLETPNTETPGTGTDGTGDSDAKNPDPDNPDPDNPDPDNPDPDNPDSETTEPLALSIDAYKTDAYSQFLERIGVSYVASTGTWRVSETLGSSSIGARLRLAVAVTWSDGAEYSQVSGEWKTIELTWRSSDPLIATVDNQGVVTALDEGQVTITVEGEGLSASVDIDVLGSDAYATKVVVIDETGEPYGDVRITFDNIDGATSRQLYARITYSDGTSASTLPDADDYMAHDLSSLTWTVSNTDAGYINATTGNFKPLEDGVLSAVAKISGGDPSVNAGVVSGSVWIVVNTGKHTSANNPSDHLTLRVVYSDDESRVFKEVTYTIDELKAIESVNATYTLTKSGGSYITDSAQGIYITTLLELIGVDLKDVSHFRFASNDNYANSGSITASALFKERFYFPMYEFNRNMFGSVQVFPMLAYADSWHEGGSCDENYDSLNTGTCLRLLFGSATEADSWTSKSFKYVHSMTVVLEGKPPAGDDPIDNPDDPQKKKGDVDGPGNGSGSGTDSTLDYIAGGSIVEDGDDVAETSLSDAGQGENDDDASSSDGEGGDDTADQSEEKSSHKFQVYQMITRDEAQVGTYDYTNPLIPFLLPALLLVALIGATTTINRYRRELI